MQGNLKGLTNAIQGALGLSMLEEDMAEACYRTDMATAGDKQLRFVDLEAVVTEKYREQDHALTIVQSLLCGALSEVLEIPESEIRFNDRLDELMPKTERESQWQDLQATIRDSVVELKTTHPANVLRSIFLGQSVVTTTRRIRLRLTGLEFKSKPDDSCMLWITAVFCFAWMCPIAYVAEKFKVGKDGWEIVIPDGIPMFWVWPITMGIIAVLLAIFIAPPIILLSLIGRLLRIVFRCRATQFPDECETVGQLAEFVLRKNCFSCGTNRDILSDEDIDIAFILRREIAKQLGISAEAIHPETCILQDLP